MTTTQDQTTELEALGSGEQPPSPSEAEVAPTAQDAGDTEEQLPLPVARLAVAVAFPVLAAAVMLGGVFIGVITPRFWAAIAGGLGIGVALWARRFSHPAMLNVVVVAGVFFSGIIVIIPAGSFSDVVNLGPFLREAVAAGDVARPPVEFTLGWRAILAWLMAGLGFASAWVAIEMRRPALALFIAIPFLGVGAVSTPDDAKIASGLISLVLFALGMGLLSGIQTDGEQRSLAFELRRAARALPLIGLICVLMYFLAVSGFLFPQPVFDPTQSAQTPRTIPLSEVEDRVLFTVESTVTGPWRIGSLDVYEEDTWKLPPFAESRLDDVPRDGIVDPALTPGVAAHFEINEMGQAVLPGLSNLHGIVAQGPALAYDDRTGTIRLSQGTVQRGLRYSVVAARPPRVEDLRQIISPLPDRISGVDTQSFLEIPEPPPAVQELLASAPDDSTWDRLFFLRNHVLDTVVASGSGAPVPVPPDRVQDMLAGSREGTPYEIVAAQAMMARWAGVPSRIGYGFDGGDLNEDDGSLEVRPRHGASFLEVYFPGFKWLPIIGNPRQAQASFAEISQSDPSILAGVDTAAQVYLPFEVEPRNVLFEQLRQVVVVGVPIAGIMLAVYFLWPALHKTWVRSRRRAWGQRAGVEARIAVAYAEWRDLATDYGYQYQSDTPLMFLERVVPDADHRELAWLVTRVLWGDMREDPQPEDAVAAEELSRVLKRRLAQAHSWSLRSIAIVSRLSLRRPYAGSVDVVRKRERDLEPV
jgi:hypothetical protein